MDLREERLMEFLAYEAFLRRAAMIDLPFMLKGSFVTRQYFSDPADRVPNDLDWVYLKPVRDPETAQQNFNEWATEITETEISDGVKFRSFQENAFWRMIDYAMSDDFPTVNTDLLYRIDDYSNELSIDISFNLTLEDSPVPLVYKPLQGGSFVIPQTVSISSQVAWKLHQTLVRPRFKDIFDLIHLLKHPDFTEKARKKCLLTLVKECARDRVDATRLKFMLEGDLGVFFPKNSIRKNWHYWRFYYESYSSNIISYEKAENITNTANLTQDLKEFEAQFSRALCEAGFTIEMIENLAPSINKTETPTIINQDENLPGNGTKTKEEPAGKRRDGFDFLRSLFK